MFAALMLDNQALVADGRLTAIAEILQVLGGVHTAVERLMNRHRFRVGLQYNDLMLLKAAHRSMGIVTACAQEIGTVVAARNRLLLALARCAHQCADVDGGEIQNVRENEVIWK